MDIAARKPPGIESVKETVVHVHPVVHLGWKKESVVEGQLLIILFRIKSDFLHVSRGASKASVWLS